MTAEVAVLNKSAVALAADSAVTVTSSRGRKTYNTVNKLFTLSKVHPVGVMVYGASEFMGVPWELIIKSFRQERGAKGESSVADYCSALIEYVRGSDRFITRDQEDALFYGLLHGFFQSVKEAIEEEVKDRADDGRGTTSVDLTVLVEDVLQQFVDALREEDSFEVSRDEARAILKQFEKEFREIRRNVFDDIPFSAKSSRRLREIAVLLLHKKIFPDNSSGLVVAGFGDEEIFPSLVSYRMHGVLRGTLRADPDRETAIAHDNQAAVIPFAQQEMVYAFMEGIDPAYRRYVQRAFLQSLSRFSRRVVTPVSGSLGQPEGQRFLSRATSARRTENLRLSAELGNYSRKNHARPIIDAVAVLPKEELALMAETLVNLTSFKRKVSLGLETVGGPIDVAVISKGDGFIWIKRKHYFQPEYNPQFLANYGRGL